MTPTLTARKADLADKIKRALRSHELGALHYSRADALAREIALEVEPGQPIRLGTKKVTLIDEFEAAKEKGIAWRPCAFRRWSFKVEPV